MRKTLLILTLLTGFFSQAQTVDFTHLNLSVRFDTITSTVNGFVELIFVKEGEVDSIYLNGVKITYQQVKLNGHEADFDFDDKGIWLKPDSSELKDTNRITISYSAKPRKGIYFIGYNDPSGKSRRQIWTQGQGIDHRHWIPHRDDQTDKVIVSLEVVFNSTYEVVANGKLIEKENLNNGQFRWHYQMNKPMSSYLIAVAIGKYKSLQTQAASGTPLTQYFYLDRFRDYNSYYYKNEDIHNFIRDEIGVDFPWQNYKQVPVQDFRHGAMENTTATIFGDFYLVDPIAFNDQNYTYVNAHELAHQWFGNLVTATGSDEHWLHEGFATYYQWLSEGHIYGREKYDWERHKAAELVFMASEMDTVPLGNGKAGSSRFYQKGGWVLHMLNEEIGRDKFRETMKHYLKKHAFGIVTTDSLNLALVEITGRDFTDFFNQWVHTAGEPVMTIRTRMAGHKMVIDADVTYLPFEDSVVTVPVTVYFKHGGSLDTALQLQPGKNDKIQWQFDQGHIDYWVVNPNMKLLAKIKEDRDYDVLEKQYENSEFLLDRYVAIKTMEFVGIKEKRKLLESIVEDHLEHFSVRALALEQLTMAEYPKIHSLYEMAFTDSDVQFQKEALALIPNTMTREHRETIARLRMGKSYELRDMAVQKSLDIDNPDNNQWLYDHKFKTQPGIPGQKVYVSTLIYRVAFYQDRNAFLELVELTSPANDFQTRINAMQALQPIEILTQEYTVYLFDALFNPNWRLRKQAGDILKGFNDEAASRKMLKDYVDANKDNWEDFQKRAVERTFETNPL